MAGWMKEHSIRGDFLAVRSNKGMNDLAKVIDSRIKDYSQSPLTMDFGTVKKNGSLKTNTFPKTIAKEDYSVLEGFEWKEEETKVLVAWIHEEAVVIGKISGT